MAQQYIERLHANYEILRSRGNVDMRLTESGYTRSEQLLMMPTEDSCQESTSLNGSECSEVELIFLDI